jgi:hypothetical protein
MDNARCRASEQRGDAKAGETRLVGVDGTGTNRPEIDGLRLRKVVGSALPAHEHRPVRWKCSAVDAVDELGGTRWKWNGLGSRQQPRSKQQQGRARPRGHRRVCAFVASFAALAAENWKWIWRRRAARDDPLARRAAPAARGDIDMIADIL